MKKQMTHMLATTNIGRIEILHYSTQSGREHEKEFIEELPIETRHEVLTLLRRIENGEVLTLPHTRV